MKRIFLGILALGAVQCTRAAVEVVAPAANQSTGESKEVVAPKVASKIEDAKQADLVQSTVGSAGETRVTTPKVELPKVGEKKQIRAFATKDASVNMTEVKKNPVFADRYAKLENAYKEVMMRLQQEERTIQQDVKAGKMTEAQVYGKSQEFEYEFRNAQRQLQEGVMALEEKVNDIIGEILKSEGWDGCQVQMFGYVNPDRDITARVVKALEEKLKAEEAAEKFKKAGSAKEEAVATKKAVPAKGEEKVTTPAGKPGVRPAPTKAPVKKQAA